MSPLMNFENKIPNSNEGRVEKETKEDKKEKMPTVEQSSSAEKAEKKADEFIVGMKKGLKSNMTPEQETIERVMTEDSLKSLIATSFMAGGPNVDTLAVTEKVPRQMDTGDAALKQMNLGIDEELSESQEQLLKTFENADIDKLPAKMRKRIENLRMKQDTSFGDIFKAEKPSKKKSSETANISASISDDGVSFGISANFGPGISLFDSFKRAEEQIVDNPAKFIIKSLLSGQIDKRSQKNKNRDSRDSWDSQDSRDNS